MLAGSGETDTVSPLGSDEDAVHVQINVWLACVRFGHIDTYIHTYIHTYIYIYIHTYIHGYIHIQTQMHACLHTCINTCTHTYIHHITYMQTYNAYTHAYIHTYIHTEYKALQTAKCICMPSTCVYIHAYMGTCTVMQSRMLAYCTELRDIITTHTHAHTHIRTHSRFLSQSRSLYLTTMALPPT